MTDETPSVFDMPDDEFRNMARPVEGTAPAQEAEVLEPQGDEAIDTGSHAADPELENRMQDPDDVPQGTPDPETGDEPETDTGPKRGPDGKFLPKEPASNKEDAGSPEDPEQATEVPENSEEPDYKAFYDEILGKPIRANGRDVTLRSLDEVKTAIQMGLNYTKKMQALQPHLRVVKMLDNNKLLDEKQLSYLIDLHQRKPEAIQKLLADSQFDPHTFDADEAARYVPENHQVSDIEMQFNAVLDEVEQTDAGQALLGDVQEKWDQESKKAIFKDPRLLIEINRQKSLGIYDRISAEVEHRRNLGGLSGMPFLAAYEMVGKEMHAQGQLAPPAPRVPVATRVATPKPKVTNTEKAKAATPPRATPPSKKPEYSPLEMSDEEFMKVMQLKGRI